MMNVQHPSFFAMAAVLIKTAPHSRVLITSRRDGDVFVGGRDAPAVVLQPVPRAATALVARAGLLSGTDDGGGIDPNLNSSQQGEEPAMTIWNDLCNP